MQKRTKVWLWVLGTLFAVQTLVAFVLLVLLPRLSIPMAFDSGEISLPRGYSICFMSSSTAVMVDSDDEVIIKAQIDGYRVYSDVIVGRVIKHKDRYWKSVPGYFVLDLKTGMLQQGLSKNDWIAKLNQYGIKKVPALHTPTGRDEMLGYNKPATP